MGFRSRINVELNKLKADELLEQAENELHRTELILKQTKLKRAMAERNYDKAEAKRVRAERKCRRLMEVAETRLMFAERRVGMHQALDRELALDLATLRRRFQRGENNEFNGPNRNEEERRHAFRFAVMTFDRTEFALRQQMATHHHAASQAISQAILQSELNRESKDEDKHDAKEQKTKNTTKKKRKNKFMSVPDAVKYLDEQFS